MGVNRIELVFLQRPVTQSELYRHIVKPATREAAIEMPQSRNDHSDDRRLDVGTRLIEDEEIEARSLHEGDAGRHLLARIEMAKLRAELRLGHRISARSQIGMVLQAQRGGAVKARFLPRPAAHETQGYKLIQLRQRPQQGDSSIEMRAGPEFNIFPPALHPVSDRHKRRDPEIAGHVEHPKPAAVLRQLLLQIADKGIFELVEVHFRPL